MSVGALRGEFRKDLAYCAACPKMCRFACPVAEAARDESLTPTSLMTRARALATGLLPWVLPETEALWGCSGCFHCRTHCAHGNAVPPALYAARAEAVRRGAFPPPVDRVRRAFERSGNPFGRPLGSGPPPSGGVLYFPGCSSAAGGVRRVSGGVDLLARAGVRARAWGGAPSCCGLPLLVLGLEEPFRRTAERLRRSLEGFDRIIAADPACALLLRDHPAYGLGGRIVSLAETLGNAPAGGGATRARTRAAYHDPCALGRGLGRYDEPRAALRALGYDLVEFSWSRAEASCCGAGGGLPWTFPRAARRMAERRLDEFRGTGADLLVTASPTCAAWLRRADPAAPVRDLSEIR